MARLTQSYAHGVSSTPLIGDTIGVHFDKSSERWPDRPALIVRQQNVRWTYRQLQERVDACAAGLLALGLTPGDRIGIWSPNNAEWVTTQLATAKAGLILVNINPAYRTYELEYALNKVGCKALITTERLQDQRLSRHATRADARDRAHRLRRGTRQPRAGALDPDPHRR
jgi:fatty-acyl-CoA synthase